nr:MAG TPA: hypothetical protein [Caudoviricetes sp.]
MNRSLRTAGQQDRPAQQAFRYHVRSLQQKTASCSYRLV